MPLHPQKAMLISSHDPDRRTLLRYVSRKLELAKCGTVAELGSELEKVQEQAKF
jgi:hypothetical protein